MSGINKRHIVTNIKKVAEIYASENGAAPFELTYQFYKKHGKYKLPSIKEHWKNFAAAREEALASLIEKSNRETIKRTDFDKTKKSRSKTKTYFVTCAPEGQPAHSGFLLAIENFCHKNNAELVILLSRGATPKDEFNGIAQNLLPYRDYFVSKYTFNKNLEAVDLMLQPQQIKPLTGIARLTENSKSWVVASPKHAMYVLPGQTPRIIHTTAACTMGVDYSETRQGSIGKLDHQVGGLIVEVVDEKIFHLRQVQVMNAEGWFYDLNKKYLPDGKVEDASVDCLYGGDLHSGWEDDTSLEATFDQIKFLNVKRFNAGDFFDAASISHHTEQDMLARLNLPEHFETLEKELEYGAKYLRRFMEAYPDLEFNMIRGNHDEHLEQYLTKMRFVKEKQNVVLGTKLFSGLTDNKEVDTPYISAVQKYMELYHKDVHDYVNWLTRTSGDNAQIKYYDGIRKKECYVQIDKHGDLGPNGMHASNETMVTGWDNITVGHSHTPMIYKSLWKAGTMSRKDLPYKRGEDVTTWMAANVAHYDNGQRQMLINLPDKKKRVQWRKT